MKPADLTDDELRAIIFMRHARLRKFHLSPLQWSLLSCLRSFERKGLTSNQLAYILNCSIQNASVKLAKLYDLGYCDRTPAPDGTGGIVYRYTSRIG